MNERITNLLYSNTFLYAILVSIGYYNLHVYYDYYDIAIYYYLTLPEILLSFLGLMTLYSEDVFFLLVLLLILVLTKSSIFRKLKGKKDISYLNQNIFRLLFLKPILSINHLRKRDEWKYLKTYIKFFHNLCLTLLGIVYVVISILPFYLMNEIYFHGFSTLGLEYTESSIRIIYLILFFFLLNSTYIVGILVKKREVLNQIKFITTTLILFFIVDMFSYLEAEFSYEEKGHYDFRFEYNNETIKTDSTLIYVGQTQNHIFLYCLPDNSNQIYFKERISNIEFNEKNYHSP